MSGQGEDGPEGSSLTQVKHQAAAIQTLFSSLSPSLRMEGLDILQGLVNGIMKKMSHGRIKCVNFVPVQAGTGEDDPAGDSASSIATALTEPAHTEPATTEPQTTEPQTTEPQTTEPQTTEPVVTEPAPALTEQAIGTVKLEVKEEPLDTWPDNDTSTAKDITDPFNTTMENGDEGPLMTSTPKSNKSSASATTRGSKRGKAQPKKTNAKRKIMDAADRIASKLQAATMNHTEDESETDVLEDSGIGDSTLDTTATTDITKSVADETLAMSAADSDPGSEYMDDFEGSPEDSNGSSDVKPTDLKNVLTWGRFPPKKRVKKALTELPYQCSECNFATGRKYSLDTHMSLHTGASKHKCTECDKVFTAASSLKRHIMLHEGLKPFNCPVCQKRFVDLAGLKTHSAVHTGERMFKCDQCEKAYTNHANLARHKRVHTGEMPYKCKYEGCDAKFRDLSSLKLHILKHTGEKPYACPVCAKRFKTSSDFRRHERTHTQERNYKCTQCDKRFIQGYHLKQHLKIHADLWLFKCDLCDKRFRTKASLQHHIKGHAGIKDYTCDLCKSSFTTKRYLNDHYIATHTNAKPYKCDICQKGFNHISNMKRHKRMHSDECKYKCQFCDKSFKYINSLQYHEGIHKGDKQMCDKCGYTCRSQFGIKNHKCDETMSDRQKKVSKEQEKEEEEGEMEFGDSSESEPSPFASGEENGEDTSSDSVQIVGIKAEPDSEDDETTMSGRRPRAAARKSGLIHTPRKSKQRAMKMIETIADDMNTKEPKVVEEELPAKKKPAKKAAEKKTGPRIKITPIVPVNPPPKVNSSTTLLEGVQTLGVVIKQEPVEIHDTNSESEETVNQNGDLPSTNNQIMKQEKEEPKKAAAPSKASKSKPKPKPKAKNQKKVSSSKDSIQDKNPEENQNEAAKENSSEKNDVEGGEQPSFSDVSVMQEAYGACTLTPTANLPNGLNPEGTAQDCTMEDLQRCLPIISQVFSQL